MDRRKFIKIIGAAGLASMLPLKYDLRKGLRGLELRKAWGFQNSDPLQKFIQPLPGLGGASGIQVANKSVDPVFNIANGFAQDTDYYQIVASEFTQQLHPALPKATKIWGYRDATQAANTQSHLGGLIIAKRGTPARLRFTNALPGTPIIPIDQTIPGAEAGQLPNRIAIHLHGGYIPWNFDGGPFDWWAPDGTHGASFTNGPVGNLNNFYLGSPAYAAQALVAGQADYIYPNDQSYRLMWYHDHALGITRTNAYAGLATGYLITDDAEAALVTNGMLPSLDYLIPLIFQDKIFIPQAGTPDPGQIGAPGDFWYSSVYDGPPPPAGYLPLPIPSVVPEFFGDTMLVNGKVFPFVEVQQRKYRFLALNACNARFLRLKLVFEDGTTGEPLGGYTNPTVGPSFVQYATEGGFLQMPVTLTGKAPDSTLVLGSAERAEWLVDFSTLPVGTRLLLYNDAGSPFPNGDPANDYYPGNPDTPQSTVGNGPNTRTIMEFRVVARVGRADRYRPLVLPPLDPVSLLPVPNNAIYRDLTLNEGLDAYGRLFALIGTNVANPNPDFGYGYPYLDSGVMETMPAGTTEVWRIANLTGDTHPMHIHLQTAQIISRRPFDSANYNGTPVYTGPARGADPNERGWKETFRMNPGEVIEIIAKWDLAPIPAGFPDLELSPRTGGNEYVWHCHILEHEEHDMMHALVVT